MRLFNRRALAMAALSSLAAVAALAAPASGLAKDLVGTKDLVGAKETALGDPKARVTVIEYASVTCPHCARFNATVMPQLKARYIDTGKVRYVFREFLTPPEALAAAGFMIARCAGPARYFAVVDALFRAQEGLYRTKNINAWFEAGGHAGGLSDDEIRGCISDAAALEAINARVDRAAQVDKISGTPTVIVNGRTLESAGPEFTIADLDAAIRPLLAATTAKPKAAPRRRPQH